MTFARRRAPGFFNIGWLWVGSAAAVILIGAIVVGSGLVAFNLTPGTHATASASASPATTTIVLPVPVREKAIAEEAETVFSNRLRALGIAELSASIGDEMRFTFVLPPSVDPADVDAVLHTAGLVEWLAWPEGTPFPNVGDQVPDGVLPLFDTASELRSVTVTAATTDQPAGVRISFGPTATQALATYTSMHLNEPMPLALDGRIITLPIIQGPITGGDLILTTTTGGSGSEPGSLSAAALAAILKSGPLPTGWSLP